MIVYVLIDYRKFDCDSDTQTIPDIITKISTDKKSLDNYIEEEIKESDIYVQVRATHEKECKNIMRKYLLNNLNAIDGFQHKYPILNDVEKMKIVDFLVNNYSYSYGKNIIEISYNNGFVDKYCDINKLSKPYPKLPKPPTQPSNWCSKSNFEIKKLKLE